MQHTIEEQHQELAKLREHNRQLLEAVEVLNARRKNEKGIGR
jgi:hypothetical protein